MTTIPANNETTIKVGLIQVATRKRDLEYNFKKCETLIRDAKRKGSDIVCTPECALDGYAFDDPEFQADPNQYIVTSRTNGYTHRFGELANELGIFLIAGMSIVDQNAADQLRNAAVLFNPGGKIVGEYYKVQSTFGNLEARFYKHGEDFPVFDLTLPSGIRTRVGIMICYDRQMPESARILRTRGAEIIFNPSATGNFRRRWNTRLLRTRAYENKCYVVSVNHAAPRINGHSLVAGPRGNLLKRCGRRECAQVVSLELNRVREKNKDLLTRRPTTYQGLAENFDPFIP